MAARSPAGAGVAVASPRVELTHLPDIAVAADGMCIEELVLQAAPPRRRGGGAATSPAAARTIALTPRSAEACLMEGVEPDELRMRSLDHFQDADLSDDIVAMRYDAFEAMRLEKVAAVRSARSLLMANPLAPSNAAMTLLAAGAGGDDGSSPAAPPRVLGAVEALLLTARSAFSPAPPTAAAPAARALPAGGAGVTLPVLASPRPGGGAKAAALDALEMERAKLAAVQARQQKEIEALVAHEMELAREQAKADEKAAAGDARQRMRDRVAEVHRRARLESRRDAEARKSADEAAEERARREAGSVAFKQQAALEAALEAKKREARAAAAAREAALVQRTAAFKAESEARQAARLRELLAREQAIEAAEATRAARMEREAAERREAMERRRVEVQARMSTNIRAARHFERQRVAAIIDKESVLAARLQERALEDAAARSMRAEAAAAEAAKRAEALEGARAAEEERRAALLRRQAEAAAAAERARSEAEHTAAVTREMARLTEAQHAAAVLRQKRKDDYQRLVIMVDVTARDTRVAEVAREKEALAAARRALALQLQRKRRAVLEAFEEARKTNNWRVAQRAVTDAVGSTAAASLLAASPYAAAVGAPPSTAGGGGGGVSRPVTSNTAGVRSRVPPASPMHAAALRPLVRRPPPGAAGGAPTADAAVPSLPVVAVLNAASRRPAPRLDADAGAGGAPRASAAASGDGGVAAPPLRTEPSPSPPPPLAPDDDYPPAEVTLKASAFARMLNEAQRDFDTGRADDGADGDGGVPHDAAAEATS